MMIAKIMVPLDGSERAERALPQAQRTAATMHATLHLVRVSNYPSGMFWTPTPPYATDDVVDSIVEDEGREAVRYLEGIQRRLQADGLSVQIHHLLGSPGPALEDFEYRERIDLVVMVSHGRSGLRRLALGSVAHHLLHQGRAPLLLVRAFGGAAGLESLVVPLDGSALSEAALEAVADLEEMGAKEVTLLRAIHSESQRHQAGEYLKELRQKLPRGRAQHICKVVRGDAAPAIVAEAGETKTIVMVTHARSTLVRLALGSVADAVSRDARTSVLLLREGAWAANSAIVACDHREVVHA